MRALLSRLFLAILPIAELARAAFPQQLRTWQQVEDQFESANPTLPGGQIRKLRTQLDIDRHEKLTEATRAQVFSDVDSAYAAVTSSVLLLHPYRDRYLRQASRVCDTIAFSYQHGAASLLGFLNAQAECRSVQNNYLSWVSSYLDPTNQLNLAVGREVIP